MRTDLEDLAELRDVCQRVLESLVRNLADDCLPETKELLRQALAGKRPEPGQGTGMRPGQLVDVVENNHNLDAMFRRRVLMLRELLDRAAEDVAECNAAWHDDAAADDYAAFHAPASAQFPRAARDAALVQLLAIHLRRLAEKEAQP